MSPEKLVSRIRSALGGTSGNIEIQNLAREYSELVSKVRDRAEQCLALIRAGDNYAALQIAESFPPLLDTAARLAFPESREWHKLCQERNATCAPPLEQHEIALISELYGKEINESHPLYRDYRKAIRERDELRALGVLGAIIRINTRDQNARHEFLRLSAKVRETHLPRLEALLDAGRNDDALALADDLERLHLPAFANAAPLARVRELRAVAEADAVRATVMQTLADIGQFRAADDWEGAATHAARLREILGKQPALHLPQDALDKLAEIELWAEAGRADSLRRRQREDAVAKADSRLKSTTTVPPRPTPAARARAMHALAAAIATGESLDSDGQEPRPSAALLAAAREQLSSLRNTERKLRIRARIIIVTLSVVFFSAVGVAFFLRQSAHSRDLAASRMEIFPLENKLLPAEAFEKTLKPSWDSHPSYREKHVRFREWAQGARRQVDELLASAETFAALSPETLNPGALREKMAGLALSRRRIETVPIDMRAIVNDRLDAAAANLERIRAFHAAAIAPGLTTRMAALETAAATAAALPTTAARLRAATELQPAIQALDVEMAAAEHLLPEEIPPRWNSLKISAAQSQKRWKSDVETDTALLREDARTLEGHFHVLRGLADALPAGESPAFAAVLNAGPAAADPAAAILAPEPAALWNTARATAPTSVPFLPAEVLPSEIEAASRITGTGAANVIENIYRYTLRPYPDAPGVRSGSYERVYSVGPARTERLPIGDGFELRQTLDLYKSGAAPTPVRYDYRYFGRRREGVFLDNPVLAPESAALRRFLRFHDATAGRIMEPPLALMERVRVTPSISPLLKAWLHQELFKLASTRPAEWGVLFSPSARDFSVRLRHITNDTMPADAWLDPLRWGDKVRPLERLYATQTFSWQEEAAARLRIFQRLSNPGFVKIGYVTSDERLQMTDARAPSGWLAGITPDGKLHRAQADAILLPGTGGRVRALRSPAPFAAHSPVLMLDTPPAAAAVETGFPAAFPAPRDGWDAYFFQPLPATGAETPAPATHPPLPTATTPAPARTGADASGVPEE
ncbi:MAG: hypothetical protein LBG65_07110 [Puniceicoccales bacterium]|jgi:hypothetical protein|nr:hypothetical protein [Puniceicoccales bacterium]